MAEAAPTTAPNDARARTRDCDRQRAETYEERVNHVADLIAKGEYLGRETAKRLGLEWGVTPNAVQGYVRAAAILVKGDGGEREEMRQISLARWQQIYLDSMAAADMNAAAKAQAGWDRAAGVVEPGGARVNIQIGDSDFGRGVARFLLAVHPEVAPEFSAWCNAVQAGDQVARNDPGRWLETKRKMLEVRAEVVE